MGCWTGKQDGGNVSSTRLAGPPLPVGSSSPSATSGSHQPLQSPQSPPSFPYSTASGQERGLPFLPSKSPAHRPPPPHLARQLSCPPLPWAWEALFGSLPRPFPKIWSRLTNKSPPQSPCAPSSVLGPQSPHPHPYPYLSTPDPSAFHPPGICPFLSPCNSGVILYIQKTVFSVI